MQFVDPDRIEQSDRVQAASFAPLYDRPRLHQFSPFVSHKTKMLTTAPTLGINKDHISNTFTLVQRYKNSLIVPNIATVKDQVAPRYNVNCELPVKCVRVCLSAVFY